MLTTVIYANKSTTYAMLTPVDDDASLVYPKKDNFELNVWAVDKQLVIGNLCTGLFFDKGGKEACRVEPIAPTYGGIAKQGLLNE